MAGHFFWREYDGATKDTYIWGLQAGQESSLEILLWPT